MSLTLGAGNYRNGASSRLEDARRLRDQGRWVGATYMAGRAAESMLRSLLLRRTGQLDVGRDLRKLLKQARSADMLATDEHRLDLWLNRIAGIWHNNLRFCGDDDFRRYLKDRKKDRGIKGDFVEYHAKRVVEASEGIVNRGDLIWARYKKNSKN